MSRLKFIKREISMKTTQSQSHSKWECKYHITWIPKYRKKTIYGQLRKHLREVFRELARQKESLILEGHLLPDHVHMLVSIPPKYAVAQVIGFIKGKSAIYIAKNCLNSKNASGHKFWARGYHVSTVGRDEEVNRRYIKEQENEDQRIDQLTFDNM
jgi:putative transposase